MASIFDRLSERLSERIGGLIDDVRLPSDVVRQLDEAEALLARGDAAGCLARVRAIDAVRPGIWRAKVLSGLAYEAAGELEEAARALTDAVEQREDTLVRVALGRIATQLGALRSAREHFDVALQRRPDEAERLDILRAAARLDEQIGPAQRAVPTLRQALRLAPHDEDLMYRLAVALQADGDVDGAITVLQPALVAEPPALTCLLLSGTLRLARNTSGDRTSARLGYERILERSSDNPDALEGLARVLMAEGQVADALPLLQQALTTAGVPAHGDLHEAIGGCYAASGQWGAALDAYRAAAAFGGLSAAVAYSGAALRAGSEGEALAAARSAVLLSPDGRVARAQLGAAELRAGDAAAAQRTLSTLRAARMEPEVLRALGELALATGDAVEAIALLREAAAAAPGEREHGLLVEQAVRRLAPALPELPPMEDLAPPQLAPFLEALSEAVARHPLLTDLIPRTTALRQHLDTPLTIAVLGEFNAGKSTLINAFLSEDVVATGVLPTTAHVNVIRYGPRKVARWTQNDGTVAEIPYVEAQRLTKKEPETVAQLEFCFPHPELRSVHFWDTPGFNAPDSEHERRAREALRTADAVVWMLDANQALTWSEFERLEAIPNRDEKLLVVLNKADRLGDDMEAREAVEAHVREHLDGEFAGLFWLSALRALNHRREAAANPVAPETASTDSAEGDDAEDTAGIHVDVSVDGGWPRFERALHDHVFERAGRLKSLEVATGLRALLRDALERAERAAREVGMARTAMAEERVELTTQQARWGAEVGAESRAELNRALQDVRAQISNEINQLAAPGPGLFGRRELPEEDRILVRERIVDRAFSAHMEIAERVAMAADSVDRELVALVEATATQVGPPESRTLRRRLEGYLGETAALRQALQERLAFAPQRVVRALTRELGEAVLDRVAAPRPEIERDAALQRLIAPVGPEYVEQVDRWGREYLGAALSLCDHVERDLDILSLDLEHRIRRPFSAVLTVIRADETDAAAQALEH